MIARGYKTHLRLNINFNQIFLKCDRADGGANFQSYLAAKRILTLLVFRADPLLKHKFALAFLMAFARFWARWLNLPTIFAFKLYPNQLFSAQKIDEIHALGYLAHGL